MNTHDREHKNKRFVLDPLVQDTSSQQRSSKI
jgi:hypothetical protein